MAKAFRFSLQKVLDVREHKEDQISIELGKAKTALRKKKDELRHLEDEKNQEISDSKRLDTSHPDLNAIRIAGIYIRQLSGAIEETGLQVDKKKIAVNERRVELLAAMKDKKIVEMLKAKKMAEHKKEILKTEHKNEDELAVRTFSRKKQERLK